MMRNLLNKVNVILKNIKTYVWNRYIDFFNSSYVKNDYGYLLYALIRTYRPEKVVELGAGSGYSSFYIARALKANGRGTIDCYDLWDSRLSKSAVKKSLQKYKDVAAFHARDVVGLENEYGDIDILCVDLNNSGDMLEKIIPKWIDKVRQSIIIEGGSQERDNVPWMLDGNKKSISGWFDDFKKKRTDVEIFTIDRFPSITLLRKK